MPIVAFATDIATCGESSGYSYYAYRNLMQEKDVGWDKAKIPSGKFSLKKNESGDVDVLIVDATGVMFSAVSDGEATIIPATISDEAVTIIVLYQNKLVETYVFQKLKSGKIQAMWTQVKTETPLPLVTAFVADCSYLNLEALK